MVPGLSNRICSQDQHADLGHISLGQQPILATMSWNVRNIVRHVRNVRNVGNVRNVPGPWEHCSGPTQGGGFAPPDPPFKSAAVAASASQVRTLEPSRPLSRPPGVGSTWSMVWNVDYRTARSSPTRPADSGTFFWAPFRNFFLQVFRRISRKCKK